VLVVIFVGQVIWFFRSLKKTGSSTMILKTRVVFLVMLTLGVASFCVRSDAGLINGSFETQMTGWTTLGPNSSVSDGTINGFNATDGNFYASLGTGAGAVSVGVHDFMLNSAGLPNNYVSSNFTTATEGATLFQTFTLATGMNKLAFSWNFLTDEILANDGINDFAFALLYNQTTSTIAGTAVLDTFSPSSPGGPEFADSTGWINVEFGGLIAGQVYTIAFGVFDVSDSVVNSGLLVDNVRAIPEPSSGLMVILTGIVATSFRRRWRRN